jgi:hypothetical protein
MFGNSPFNLPLPQGVLKTLGAESKVFEQQGQQGGQGGQGYGPCEDNTPSNSDMREKYSDSNNEFYLFQVDNGWGNDVQVVQWSGSTPSEAIKRQYLSYLRYTNRVNRNALQGGCVPQMQSNYANPGFVVLYPTTGLWGDKSDRNSNTGVRIFEEVWEGAKAQHEGAFAGCMESTASNYNANAAIDNGSCVWNWRPYESTFMNWGGNPRTNKTTDGFRYIWEVDSMEVLSAYDAANSKLRGRWKISKVCESKSSCGEPSTEPKIANRTLPTIIVSTGTIAHPNGVSFSDWTTAKNTAKSQGQSAINTLFANHVAPPCREGQTNISNWSGFVPQPCDNSFSLTVKRSMVYCDNSNDWIRAEYTLNRDGVAQQTWTVSNNTSYTSSLSDAMRAQHLNTSTGNYSWIDGAQALVDAHETALSTTTTTEDYKINNGWRRNEIPASKVIDRSNYNFFLPWATRTLTTTSCGTTRSQGPSYISIYRFTDTGILNAKPTATNENGKVVVKWKGEILTPFETLSTTGLTQAQEDALTEPYYVKVGCMDASATNYDPEANANSKPGGSSVACVWDCTEDDGRGLMPNCRTCLPDADKNLVDMVFDVSTNTWSCPATGGGDGGDPPLDEEPSILDSEWLPFAAIGGLILLALGMG